MDLSCREIGGGVALHQHVVVGRAVWQCAGGDGVAGEWQVVALERRLQLAVGRHDAAADERTRLGSQRLALDFRQRGGELLEWRVERAAAGVIDDLRRNLRRHAVHQHTRRHAAGLQACLQQPDGLLHPCRQCGQAAEVLAVLRAGGKGHRLRDAVGRLHTALVADGLQVFLESLSLHGQLKLPLEGVEVQLVGCRQPRARDRPQALQRAAIGGFARGYCREADVGPAVVVARVALVAGALRAVLHAAFPFAGEEGVKGLGMRL